MSDWRVTLLTYHGPNGYYCYTVEGENLNYPAHHPDRRFRWRIPARSLENPRYDLTGALCLTVSQ